MCEVDGQTWWGVTAYNSVVKDFKSGSTGPTV